MNDHRSKVQASALASSAHEILDAVLFYPENTDLYAAKRHLILHNLKMLDREMKVHPRLWERRRWLKT